MKPVVYHITGINPEPWEAARTAPGRKDGKLYVQHYSPEQMRAYQAAVKEELGLQNGHLAMVPDGTLLAVTFYLWRQQAEAEIMGSRNTRAHEVDTTNCQKSLEDALQKLVYKNDKYNRDVRSVIMDQGPDVEPHITIVIAEFVLPEAPERPDYGQPKRGNVRETKDLF